MSVCGGGEGCHDDFPTLLYRCVCLDGSAVFSIFVGKAPLSIGKLVGRLLLGNYLLGRYLFGHFMSIGTLCISIGTLCIGICIGTL